MRGGSSELFFEHSLFITGLSSTEAPSPHQLASFLSEKPTDSSRTVLFAYLLAVTQTHTHGWGQGVTFRPVDGLHRGHAVNI